MSCPTTRTGHTPICASRCWPRSRTRASDRAPSTATRSRCAARARRRSCWSGRRTWASRPSSRRCRRSRSRPATTRSPRCGRFRRLRGSRACSLQLVEIPGLIGGASDDRGGGRALLGVLRSADAIVYCARAGYPAEELETVRDEVEIAGIDKPAILAVTRADEGSAEDIDRLRRRPSPIYAWCRCRSSIRLRSTPCATRSGG